LLLQFFYNFTFYGVWKHRYTKIFTRHWQHYSGIYDWTTVPLGSLDIIA